MIADELAHTIKSLVAQAVIEQRPWVYGHISSYDPATHTARVIVPSLRDDRSGAPMHSGWLPMATSQSGAQSGMQVVPIGGATADNPTQGEQCLVALNERGTGVAAIVSVFYTGAQRPPHTQLPHDQGLAPGELIVRHKSGTIVRFHNGGNLEITTGGDGAVTITTSGSGGVQILTTGSGEITLTSPQKVTVDCPVTEVLGDLHVTGEVWRGWETDDQVSVGQHQHGVSDTPTSGTRVPTPGR